MIYLGANKSEFKQPDSKVCALNRYTEMTYGGNRESMTSKQNTSQSSLPF